MAGAAAGASTVKGTATPYELSAAAIALRDTHGLALDVARGNAQEPLLLGLFTGAIDAGGASAAKAVGSLLANDVLGELRSKKLEKVPFDGGAVVELAGLVKDGTISNAQTKEVLAGMLASGKGPKAIVAEKGLAQIATSDALGPIVDQVLTENAEAVGRYKAGNVNVVGALVGMVMKKSGGRANAKLVKELLEQKLA